MNRFMNNKNVALLNNKIFIEDAVTTYELMEEFRELFEEITPAIIRLKQKYSFHNVEELITFVPDNDIPHSAVQGYFNPAFQQLMDFRARNYYVRYGQTEDAIQYLRFERLLKPNCVQIVPEHAINKDGTFWVHIIAHETIMDNITIPYKVKATLKDGPIPIPL